MKKNLIAVIVVAVLIVAGIIIFSVQKSNVKETEITSSVNVLGQKIKDNSVIIEKVVATEQSWIVIHADVNGSPGEVIGHAAVNKGENTDVTVNINTNKTTSILYAMLHFDVGEIGVYEFPEDDLPVKTDNKIVIQSFSAEPEILAEQIPPEPVQEVK